VSCRARMEGRSPNESGPPVVHSNTASPGFGSLEKLIAGQAVQRTESGGRTDWLEVEGCWVLQPPGGARPQAVAMFCGGAFAGAAPQLTYRLLIECLTKRNILVSLFSLAVPASVAMLLSKNVAVFVCTWHSSSCTSQHLMHMFPHCAGRGGALQHGLQSRAHRGRGTVQV